MMMQPGQPQMMMQPGQQQMMMQPGQPQMMMQPGQYPPGQQVPPQYAQQHLQNDLARVQQQYNQPGYGGQQQMYYDKKGKKMKMKDMKKQHCGYGHQGKHKKKK